MKTRIVVAVIVWIILMLQGLAFVLMSGFYFPSPEAAAIMLAAFIISDFAVFLIVVMPGTL